MEQRKSDRKDEREGRSHLFPYLILIFKHSVIIKLTKVGWEIVMKNSDWLSDRAKHEIQAKDAQAFWTIQCFKNE